MTTRSTKMIPSVSSNPSNSNPQTPTKRKRPQHDNPGSTSWLGIAFQLPSVIKKEINDFVKTIRGGTTTQSTVRPNADSTRNNPKVESERTKRQFHRRLSQSVTAGNDHGATRNFPSAYRSIHRRGPTLEQAGSSSRIRSPEFSHLDLPSPPKKLKRSDMSSLEANTPHESFHKNPAGEPEPDQQQSSSQNTPGPASLIQSTSSMTSQPNASEVEFVQAEPDGADHILATTDLPGKIKQFHEAHGTDAEMEEIICNRPKKVGNLIMCQSSGHLIGYNSVLFPDSRNAHPCDSPGSSVNADVSSSTWQASSSFSTNSGSNMHRGFSNHTSLTSNTSVELNLGERLQDKGHHTVRLDSVSSQPSPRIRHTKILGSPRNHHTLSASSLSSFGSVLTSDVITRHNSHSQLQGGPQHTLAKGIGYSFSNVDPPSDNEREFLTSDSDMNHDSPAAIQIGRRLSSHRPTLTCRRKVPLSEIIGRPLNPTPSLSSLQSHPDYCRESFKFHPSQSMASITSTFTGSASASLPSSGLQSPPPMAELQTPGTECNHNNMEESSTSAADSSATLSILRNQLSNTMRIGPSSPAESVPNALSQSLPSPRQTPHQAMIMEVDEEGEDNSYEFLDRAEAQSLSPETPHRKRKRLLHRSDLINFRRQGFAAVQHSPSKLIDLPSNPSSTKSKSNVIKMLRLSRGHKRHQSNSQDNHSGVELAEDDAQSPTKKIRILESEIARLRRELENEKTKSAKKFSMHKSYSQPTDLTETHPTTSSSRTPLRMFSPVASRPSSRHQRLRDSMEEPEVASDSPVMVRKPPDGALVGGSPFIVSRVFGQGPEVVGESTPAQAEKWHQKRKTAVVNQGGARFPSLAHDLFGAKSSKLSSSASATNSGRAGSPISNANVGWKRDHQLEADLITTPKPRTLKKIHRNSKGATAMPSSQLRNMFSSSTNDPQRNSGPSAGKGRHTTTQPPDMSNFLNELKASGKTKLRKTPGSSKYYMSQSITSPKASPCKQKNIPHRRSVDIHSASILNSVLQNFGGRESDASRGSAWSSRTETTAASTNTHDSDRAANGSRNSSVSNAANHRTSLSYSEQKPSSSDQIKSPLSLKVYPSGAKAKKSHAGNDDGKVQVVLGEAISTPRKSKQAAHLSRSLVVDPHLTPRVRACNDVSEPISTLEKDFTMDDLIKQVKDLKDNEAVVNGKPGSIANPLQNHALVHEMGFCSSIENSLELSSSLLTSTASSAPHDSSMKPNMNVSSVCQDINRQRTSPLLKNLTEGRPKLSTSPIKNPKFVAKPVNNRWSSSSTIRLVSILNNSSDGRSSLDRSGPINPSLKSRSKPNERRVRILEDTTNLNNSILSTDHNVHRHSLPADLITRNLINSSDIENRDVKEPSGSGATSQKSPDWVLLKPDSKHSGDGEPNVRRWSLRASAILSTHPKIT